MKVKSILVSCAENVEAGTMTFREAGDKLYAAGWFNYRPTILQVRNLLNL